MAFFKRVFSSDYRRALAAEAAGEYVEAARAYALAGERDKVGEMHLLAAERASGREARILGLRSAARWCGDGELGQNVRRRIARALLEAVRSGGLITEGDRAVVQEAAELFRQAGDGAGAGEALELCGDEQGAADAYQSAGEVERLEEVLSRDEQRRVRERQLREATEQYQRLFVGGARTAALERLQECARLDPAGPSRQLAEVLGARRITRGVVALRSEAGRAALVCAGDGAFPVGIGRDPACGMALRDARVSRIHAEIDRRGDGFIVRDAGSRNGTRLGGVTVEGDLPLEGHGEIGLGDAVRIAFRREGSALRLEVSHGTDRGLVAFVCGGPLPLAGGAVVLRFAAGVPLLEIAPGHGAAALRLDGAAVAGAVELIHGDRLEIAGAGDSADPPQRLDVE